MDWRTQIRGNPAFQKELRERVALRLQQEERRRQLGRPVEWIERKFWIPEVGDSGGPIELFPYQKAVIREAYRRDAAGDFVYDLVLWSDIKKSAKSTIAAAVALHRAWCFPWATIRIVANDLKQADSRVAYYVRRAVDLNPELSERIRQVRYKTMLPNRSTIEAIPIDPGGEAGGGDHLIVFSELWAAKHDAMKQMWTEMTLSPLLRGKSQRWIETYAGYEGESPLLESLYAQGVEGGRHLDLSYTDAQGHYHDLSDLPVYAAGGMLCLWNDSPRLPWQTAAYYNSESRTLDPAEFQRIHRNQWVSSTDQFVPSEWWEKCRGALPVINKHTPLILGVDAAVSGACVALVAVSGVGGRGDTAAVHYARKWDPPEGGKIDYQGTAENPGVEREIRRLAAEYNVVEVRYDPYQLHDMATRLSKERVANMVEFTQGAPREKADKQLYDRIREGRIVHAGFPALDQHIGNANRKLKGTESDNQRMRIVQRNERLYVDLAVSLSMAAYDPDVENIKTARSGRAKFGKAR